MSSEYSKKAALVTGGAQGIGAAIARTLAARGSRVAVADIQASAAFFFVRCDVSREADVRRLLIVMANRDGSISAAGTA